MSDCVNVEHGKKHTKTLEWEDNRNRCWVGRVVMKTVFTRIA